MERRTTMQAAIGSWAIWITGRPGSGKSTIATAPRRVWRELARHLAPRFAEVQLVRPPEVSGEREPQGRWLSSAPAAPRGGPDLVVEYEESRCADLVLHTHVLAQWSAAERIVQLARRLAGRSPADTAERSR